MQPVQRVEGERSHLSTVFGRYAPEAQRITETAHMVAQLDDLLAPEARVPRRTEKVYGLWERVGERQEAKVGDVVSATEELDTQDALRKRRDQVFSFVAGMLTMGGFLGLAWVLFG